MTKPRVLILDDESVQASALAKALEREMLEIEVDYASSKEDILRKVVCTAYSIAIVDLRMDKYEIDGVQIIHLISDINPYAKIIAVSAYTSEYQVVLSEFLSQGKILAICEKDNFDKWIPKIKSIISTHIEKSANPIATQVLLDEYETAKNELDTFRKGVLFEEFVVNVFRQMGFFHIERRKRDSASNEVDLIVRNDISDPIFAKFNRYIFVECKNKPEEGFSKNDFIVFNSKINSSHGDCNFGVVFTTGIIKRTVYLEALKESRSDTRMLYLSSAEILRLIRTPNMLEEFKCIMDEQVF